MGKLDQRSKLLIVALLLSIFIHIGLLWFIGQRDLLAFDNQADRTSIPQELTFVFPENQPESPEFDQRSWEIVQNINENDQIPEQTNLLSDRHSQARNPERNYRLGDSPQSEGNSPFANLSGAPSEPVFKSFSPKRFSSEALTGSSTQEPRDPSSGDEASRSPSMASDGSNQMLDQKKFSVEEVGSLSLSTYQWEWAPYINAMKNKLYRVWYAPSAYYELGLIYGYTVIIYTIDRSGNITRLEVLKHEGHSSLEKSSVDAIQALFPFLPLPDNFPEETLTITAKLYYPDLRARR